MCTQKQPQSTFQQQESTLKPLPNHVFTEKCCSFQKDKLIHDQERILVVPLIAQSLRSQPTESLEDWNKLFRENSQVFIILTPDTTSIKRHHQKNPTSSEVLCDKTREIWFTSSFASFTIRSDKKKRKTTTVSAQGEERRGSDRTDD